MALADRKGALLDLQRHLGSITGPARAHVEPDKQRKRIAGLLRRTGLPDANLTSAFIELLQDRGSIPSYWTG